MVAGNRAAVGRMRRQRPRLCDRHHLFHAGLERRFRDEPHAVAHSDPRSLGAVAYQDMTAETNIDDAHGTHARK